MAPHISSALMASLALASPALAQDAIMTFFLPDSEPLSLDASIKTVHTTTVDRVSEIITVMQVDCPKAESPENDACRSVGIYPADVYHTRGSVWGGTTTYSADDSTTTWRCELQGGLGGPDGLEAACSKTIVSGGNTKTESVSYANCDAVAHLLPIVVTAGGDILGGGFGEYTDSAGEVKTIDADFLNNAYNEELSSAGCPTTKTTMFAGATAGPGPTASAPGTEATGDADADAEGNEQGDGKEGKGSGESVARVIAAPVAWIGIAVVGLTTMMV